MCVAFPQKYPGATVIGLLKGKSPIAMARLCAKMPNFFHGRPFLGLWVPCPPSDVNWGKFASTYASTKIRMGRPVASKICQPNTRFSATPRLLGIPPLGALLAKPSTLRGVRLKRG